MAADPENATPDIASLAAEARRAQQTVMDLTGRTRTELPLRYLRQQAHLTAPASEFRLAEKALSGAYAVAARLLERYAITSAQLADRLEVAPEAVDAVLGENGAPLVLIDLEDGVAPSKVSEARENAVRLVCEVDRGDTLCFLRPAGVADPRCAEDLVELLVGVGAGRPPERYPLDGIVLPKVRHVHEVEWVDGVLASVEASLGLERNRIRVSFQVETAWGVLNLPALTTAGLARLSGLILGTVDLSADVMLSEVRYRHPVCEWARTVIVLAAGACDVPAIDGMTLDFPVGLPHLEADQNHALVLDRMAANFDDAVHSIDHGMSGRWVGHPLQLLATALAFRHRFSTERIERDLATVERFAGAIAGNKGAAAGAGGELLDIGTDRHLRRVLRRATAWGLLPPARAGALGIVDERDAKELPA